MVSVVSLIIIDPHTIKHICAKSLPASVELKRPHCATLTKLCGEDVPSLWLHWSTSSALRWR